MDKDQKPTEPSRHGWQWVTREQGVQVMDKELIERLAREAGYDTDDGAITMPHHHADGPADERSHLERFAALIAEECAKVADETQLTQGDWAITDCGVAADNIREKFCAKG